MLGPQGLPAARKTPCTNLFALCTNFFAFAATVFVALFFAYQAQLSFPLREPSNPFFINSNSGDGVELRETLRQMQLQLSAVNHTLQGQGGAVGLGLLADGLKCECKEGAVAASKCPPCATCPEIEKQDCICPPVPDCPEAAKQECNCPPPGKGEEGCIAASETEMKARVLECFRIRSSCESIEDDLCQANQVKVQAFREKLTRDAVQGQLTRLYDHPVIPRLNLSVSPGGYTMGKAMLDNLTEGTQDEELWEFVMLYKIHRGRLNDTEAGRAQLDVWVNESREEEARANALADSLEPKLTECKAKLLDRCGIQMPLDNWREAQDLQINKMKGEETSDTATAPSYELRLEKDAELRGGGGLRAPRELWKLQPNLYPDSVNVSFLLQYYNQLENVKPIVERLYECTHGWRGDGQLGPGVTSELIVNVDEPGGVDNWMEEWKLTDPGSFLVPVFQHNLHELRGFNRAAGAARGKLFILLQDDDIPPQDCGWVANVLTAFNAWPRLGVIGLRGGVFTIGATSVPGESKAFMGRFASDSDRMVFRDTSTNLRMQFVSVVDLAPMVFRRETYEDVGGMNESNGKKGEPGIMSDWEVSMRVWMGGWHVAQLYLNEEHRFGLGAQPGGTHVGVQAYLREKNFGMNSASFGRWATEEYHERVYQEVKRMNLLLEGPSDPEMYI